MVAVHSAFWKSTTSVAWWRQPGEGRVCNRATCESPRVLAASASLSQPVSSPLPPASPGPETAQGPGPRRQGGRQPLPAKQTCSPHIHFVKTNGFLESLLASGCLFSFGLTVGTRVDSQWGQYGAERVWTAVISINGCGRRARMRQPSPPQSLLPHVCLGLLCSVDFKMQVLRQ